jgi:hypothetical protein
MAREELVISDSCQCKSKWHFLAVLSPPKHFSICTPHYTQHAHKTAPSSVRWYQTFCWCAKEVNPFNEAVSLSSQGTASPTLLWLITRGFSLGASIINVAINSDVRKVERSLPSSRRPGLRSICLLTPSTSPREAAFVDWHSKDCRLRTTKITRPNEFNKYVASQVRILRQI